MRIFSSVTFAVFYSSLLLYAIDVLHFSSNQAIAITGGFLALNFGLPMIGGAICGKYLNHLHAFCFAIILQLISGLLLYAGQGHFFYWSLSFFLAGSMLLTTSLNMLLTEAFPDNKIREKAFIYNYAGMNFGYFSGYALAGYFGLTNNYHLVFLIASILSGLALGITVIFWEKLTTPSAIPMHHSFLGIAAIIISIPIIRALFLDIQTVNYLIILLWALAFLFITGKTLYNQNRSEKKHMWVFLTLVLAGIIFWSIYLIAPMGLMVFIKNNVNTTFMGYLIAPQWFQDINTFVIVVGSPILAYIFKILETKGIEISIATKFVFSIAMMGIGLLTLAISTHFAATNGLINFWWVVASYVFQSIGELFIGPIGWSIVGQLVHKKKQSTMMGFWITILGVSSSIASLCSSQLTLGLEHQNPVIAGPHYSIMFGTFGIIAVLTAIALGLSSQKIGKALSDN